MMGEIMNFYKAYIKNHLSFFILSFALWLLSAFAGIYAAFAAEGFAAQNVAGYISSVADAEKSFGAIFKNGLITNFKYTLFMCISSSFVVLLPVSLFLIGFKGFSAGFTSMFLIRLFGIKGVGASLFSVVLPLFLSLPPLSLMFVICLCHPIESFKMRKRITSEEKGVMQLKHIGKMLVLYAVLCAISLFEAVLSPLCFNLLR